jgi:hypothetical protein
VLESYINHQAAHPGGRRIEAIARDWHPPLPQEADGSAGNRFNEDAVPQHKDACHFGTPNPLPRCGATPVLPLFGGRQLALFERKAVELLAARRAFLHIIFAFAVSHRPSWNMVWTMLPSCFAANGRK